MVLWELRIDWYISANTFGAFSTITVHGLLYTQTRRFITRLLHRPPWPLRWSRRGHRSYRGRPRPPKCWRPGCHRIHTAQVWLEAVPADDLHLLAHLDLPSLVGPLQHLVGATLLVRHGPLGPPLSHVDPNPPHPVVNSLPLGRRSTP